METATKDNWKTEPLPEQNITLSVERCYTKFEMGKIHLGFIPQQMEDKWFAYVDDNKLYWHRSWTGFCIYVAVFKQDGDTYCVEELQVNRNPEQYRGVYDDAGVFLQLVDNLLINRRI